MAAPTESFDVCGRGVPSGFVPLGAAGSYTHDSIARSAYQSAKAHNLAELHQEYADYEARLRSYPDVPPHSSVPDKQSLAAAGFIWRGPADNQSAPDRVECFWCGLELDGWEEGDDPWIEHAKNQQEGKTCKYLVMNKGQNFIDEAKTSSDIPDASGRSTYVGYQNGRMETT